MLLVLSALIQLMQPYRSILSHRFLPAAMLKTERMDQSPPDAALQPSSHDPRRLGADEYAHETGACKAEPYLYFVYKVYQ